jgi:hypothetical protein
MTISLLIETRWETQMTISPPDRNQHGDPFHLLSIDRKLVGDPIEHLTR